MTPRKINLFLASIGVPNRVRDDEEEGPAIPTDVWYQAVDISGLRRVGPGSEEAMSKPFDGCCDKRLGNGCKCPCHQAAVTSLNVRKRG
jgi:hypothetical protein